MATRSNVHHRHQHHCRQELVVENENDLIHHCINCNKSFTRKRDLNRHLRTTRVHVQYSSTANGGYSCRICTKVFTRQDSLQKHEGNKSCMNRYFQILRGAGAWVDPLLHETPMIEFLEPTTPETDYYYNSNTQSIAASDIQDDNSVETPSSSTTSSFSNFS